MKNYASALLFTLSALAIDPTVIIAKTNINLMSYNIRRDGDEKDPKNLWPNRKNSVMNLLLEEKPTIIGIQEADKGRQSEDLEARLSSSGYRLFGKNRSETMTGLLHYLVMKHEDAKKERNPIAYNTNEVKLIDSGNFGINPAGQSLIFTAWLPRICTWGLFEDIHNKKRFRVYNTHLDNGSKSIRTKQMKMILDHAAKDKSGIPTFIMGDLNTQIEGDIKTKLNQANFTSARDKATTIKGPQETRTGWNDDELKKIDHILVKNAKVAKYEVVESPKGQYPSDHRPVYAKIVLP